MSTKMIRVFLVGTPVTYVLEIDRTAKVKDVLHIIDADGYFLKRANGYRFARGQCLFDCVEENERLSAVPINYGRIDYFTNRRRM